MNKNSYKVVVTLLALVVALTFSNLYPLTDASGITISEAIEKVKQFMDDPALILKYEGQQAWFHMDCSILSSDGARFYVELDKGLVRGIRSVNTALEVTEVFLSLEEAEKAAEDFLTTHNILLTKEMVQTAAEFFDHGTSGKEYRFHWHKIVKDVKLPTFIEVVISATTGELIEFTWVDIEVKISTIPKITHEQAVEIASSQVNFIVVNVLSTDLAVWFDHEDKQVLWWIIGLEGAPIEEWTPASYVFINAFTGEIIYVLHRP